MFGKDQIQVGAGRYFQHAGALSLVGSEVSFFGKRILLLFGDELVLSKTHDVIIASLIKAKVSYITEVCELPSTEASFCRIAEKVQETDADMIMGIGGGRVIDVAKGAADLLGIPVFTAPTSAATCAAYAVLYVVYSEEGFVKRSGFMKHEISAVFADLNFIIRDCPSRYFASGIADAMAKKPEFLFTMLRLGKEGMIPTAEVATLVADYTFQRYVDETKEAMRAFQAKEIEGIADYFVNLNIMLTGMISDLSTGGKQLAIAHNFYDAICGLHRNIRKEFLHGELVGLAIPVQMSVNGSSEEEIQEVIKVLKFLGIPVRLDEIGFPMETFDEMVHYVSDVTIKGDAVLEQSIRDGMRWIL